MAAISLSEIKLIFARPISPIAYISYSHSVSRVPAADREVKQDGISRPFLFFSPAIAADRLFQHSTVFTSLFIFIRQILSWTRKASRKSICCYIVILRRRYL